MSSEQQDALVRTYHLLREHGLNDSHSGNAGTCTPDDSEGAYYFPKVPVIDIPHEHDVSEAPAAVAGALRAFPVALVRGHRIYAWGRSLDEANKRVASLEASARTSWLAAAAGTSRRQEGGV